MTDPQNLAELEILHQLSKAYGQRPSGIIGIQNHLAAYDFDKIVLYVGAESESRALKNMRSNDPEQPPNDPAQEKKYSSWKTLRQAR